MPLEKNCFGWMLLCLWVVSSFLLCLLSPLAGHADSQSEIAHLLHFVESSQCTFIRNGKRHEALEAKEHLQKKYDYLKSRVTRAEDFIRYAATQSSMSGKAYMIECNEETRPSSEWLQDELDRYRQENSKTGK